MKFLYVLLVFFLWNGANAYAQCSFEKYTQKGIKMLTHDHEGFTYLKSFDIAGVEGKKFSYIFTHGSNYLITLANGDVHSKGVFINIYDSNDKLVATSQVNGKFYPTIQFNCKATGIYQLKFTFEGADEHCAVGVLGMKR